jgi:hypothetical protein
VAIAILPAFPEKCFLTWLVALCPSLWAQIYLGVKKKKDLALQLCFLANSKKNFLSYFLGLVLSITTLLPFPKNSSATL